MSTVIEESKETEDLSVTREIVGLIGEMAMCGLEEVERKTDQVFEHPLTKWLSWKLLERFQVQPDGHYFKSRMELAWEGYETEEDEPKSVIGKFEMEI